LSIDTVSSDSEEVTRLRAELAEARQALAAIRSGSLDAVVGEDELTLYTRTSAERIYRLIIERMLEGAVTLSEDGVIVYCNSSFATMLGRAAGIVGQPLAPWLVAHEDTSVEALIGGPQSHHDDFGLRCTDGTIVPVSISASSIEDDNGGVRCLVFSDLRARKDAARLREIRDELERANQRKDEFLAMLGHELRNPLAPVRQAAELLHAHASDEDPPFLGKARSVLARQIVHLTRLVDDLLDAGRITQGTLVIKPASIDLREVVETAVESVDRLFVRRQHVLTVDLPPAAVRCSGDAVRLAQVVTNLLSNAAKYTPDGGRVEVSLAEREGWATITVRDNGRGMPAELIPHLFDPFVRGQTTIDRRTGGLGVGLTLVQRLVELHEGRVSATSDGPGAGSEFRVALPLEERVQPAVVTTSDAPAKSTRVLVVDDNEDAADMLTLVLRSRGHHVEVAYDGAEALTREAELVPEVVCLDIGLPRVDGYEAARRIRARRGSSVTLLALTGYGRDEDRQRAKQAGFDRFFVKPVTADELETAFSAPGRQNDD